MDVLQQLRRNGRVPGCRTSARRPGRARRRRGRATAKSRSGGQPQRREAEAGACRAPRTTWRRYRRRACTARWPPRVLGEQRGGHRVDQRAVERGLDGRQVGDPLAVDVRAEQLVDLAANASCAPRQHPAVDDRLGGRRDDVRLVAGGEHRRVRGVAHRRADRSARARRAWPIEPSRSSSGNSSPVISDSARGTPGPVGDDQRERCGCRAGDGLGELRDRVVVVGSRAVPRRCPSPAASSRRCPSRRSR